MSRPLRSTPTPASRRFTATTGRSASERRLGTQCLRFLPSARSLSRPQQQGPAYRRSPSHVPCKSRRPGSHRLYAGHHLANKRAPARLIPEEGQGPPVLMSPKYLRRFNNDTRTGRPDRALLARLPDPHLTRSSRAFSLSLSTTVFSQCTTGRFSACPRRPTLEGQLASISRTAPPMRSSYMAPPSAFVTHCPDIAPR